MLIRKLVMGAALMAVSSFSQAELIRISGSGEVNASDYTSFGALAEPLPTLSFSFETVFDLDNFTTAFVSPTQGAFLYPEHDTSLTVNGETAPDGFHRNGFTSGERHVIENALSVPDPFMGTPASAFHLDLGTSFEQATRFAVDANYYIRDINVFGAIADLFPTADGLDSPDRIIDAILNNFSGFLSINANVWVGELGNPDDNTVALARANLGSNFNIQAQLVSTAVSEPAPIALSVFGLLMLIFTKQRKLKSSK